MAGPELVADVGVVLRLLVDILDQERNRRAGRDLCLHPLVLKDAGEDAHPVGLLPLGHEFGLAGLSPVEIGLDHRLVERDPRRAAIDHTPDRRPMALAEGRDAEEVAEAVVAHSGAGFATEMSGASSAFMPTT